MEVALTTGASLRKPIEWHGINWANVNRTGRRLQVRIVKAIRVVASFTGRLNGLSLLRRKTPGGFFGGGGWQQSPATRLKV
jgi:hypothetical protein